MLTAGHIPAAILAGGRSSRFGSDKALVELDGQPLLQRLRAQLQATGRQVWVVADRRQRYAQLGIECLVDCAADRGPLAGVASGLQQRLQVGKGWLLVLTCDQAVWRESWCEQLLQQLTVAEDEPACDAVHFAARNAHGKLQCEPFPSLLHTRLLPRVLQHVSDGPASMRALLAAVATRAVPVDVTPRAWSFNTPDEWQRLQPGGPPGAVRSPHLG